MWCIVEIHLLVINKTTPFCLEAQRDAKCLENAGHGRYSLIGSDRAAPYKPLGDHLRFSNKLKKIKFKSKMEGLLVLSQKHMQK